MSYEPCKNPSCPSYGKPHPNCKCFASGGAVCHLPHMPECEHFASGGEIEKPLHPGATVESHVLHSGLVGLFDEVGKHEDASKSYEKYLSHAKKGHSHFKHHMATLLDKQSTADRLEPDVEAREKLKKHLEASRLNPEQMLNIGGNLGEVSPSHAGALAATAGNAAQYLNHIRPMKSQNSPLDELAPVSKLDENIYNRHLDIANNPRLVAQHISDGTILPGDVKTLKTLYPNIHQNMLNHATETMLDKKNDGISYKHKKSLSALFEQSLDSTMTPASAQAIMQANAPELPPAGPSKQHKKASGAELNQLNKVNKMALTPLEKLATK